MFAFNRHSAQTAGLDPRRRSEGMNAKTMFSSKSIDWETPKEFFAALDAEFHFTLDPCASKANHKCNTYFTVDDDGLAQSWAGHNVFCNPPYGKTIGQWVKKGYEEAKRPDTVVVCLLPARTDTKYCDLRK